MEVVIPQIHHQQRAFDPFADPRDRSGVIRRLVGQTYRVGLAIDDVGDNVELRCSLLRVGRLPGIRE